MIQVQFHLDWKVGAAVKLRRDLLTLAVIFGGLYFFILARAPLSNPDEGRYAEIPREMVATGDWVTPRLDGIDYFEKPPLLYWAVAASTTLFGPSEGAMRAVPALFALMGVLLTYGAARQRHIRTLGRSLVGCGPGRIRPLFWSCPASHHRHGRLGPPERLPLLFYSRRSRSLRGGRRSSLFYTAST